MPAGSVIFGEIPAAQFRQVSADPSLGVGLQANVGASVDGTPSRVAGILLLSVGVLAALKLMGFRFNVGVS